MKCPSCGQEVVIATDLCPYCGYRHDFDGSISPKPEYREPGEDRWVEAGVFRRRRERGRRREEARAEAEAEAHVNPGRGDERVETDPGAQSSALGMRWYNFVVSVLLPLTGVFYLFSSISALAGTYIYARSTELIQGAVYLVFGVLAFAAMKKLKNRERSGVRLYLLVILIPAIVRLTLGLLWRIQAGWLFGLGSLMLEFVISVAYAVITSIYFGRRTA